MRTLILECLYGYCQSAGTNGLCGRCKKGRGREEGEKNERGEGRGAPAIRAGVFVFNCQYMTNHK